MNIKNEADFVNDVYSLNIKNFIKKLEPETTNMYLYPAMLRIAYAIEQNRGSCYDAFTTEMYSVKAVIECNNSVAAWLCGEQFDLRLINVAGGVPILGKTISTNVDNADNFEDAIRHYNKENNNAIRSYYLIRII